MVRKRLGPWQGKCCYNTFSVKILSMEEKMKTREWSNHIHFLIKKTHPFRA
jgi:hypothetical protein